MTPNPLPLPEEIPLPPTANAPSPPPPPPPPAPPLPKDEDADKERELMARVMGFSEFDSTKNKMVPGNNVGAVHVAKKRRYRQYMNRKGGFNRPLDKVA